MHITSPCDGLCISLNGVYANLVHKLTRIFFLGSKTALIIHPSRCSPHHRVIPLTFDGCIRHEGILLHPTPRGYRGRGPALGERGYPRIDQPSLAVVFVDTT
jgi:hypothetical protein